MTSQSLEFDVVRSSYPPPFPASEPPQTMPMGTMSNPPPPPAHPAVDRKAQVDLERRLARLEAENEKLKKEVKEKVRASSSVASSRYRASNPNSGGKENPRFEVSMPEDETGVFEEVKKSLEKGLAAMAKVERGRQAELRDALRDLKAKQKEVVDLRKSR